MTALAVETTSYFGLLEAARDDPQEGAPLGAAGGGGLRRPLRPEEDG